MPVISRPQKTAIKVTISTGKIKEGQFPVVSRQDVPMRIFSQPSNIDNANVDSNSMSQRQMICLKVDFGGV